MWKAVNTVLGKSNKNAKVGIDPVALSTHYASVSTDAHHLPIKFKSTCLNNVCYITEEDIFYALDHLKQTAAGPDELPSWFLKLAAPGIAVPLTYLVSLSLSQSTVPSQWKSACITLVAKLPLAKACCDF